MICWDIDDAGHELALAIADRAVLRGYYDDAPNPFMTAYMDIVACHMNGNALDLAVLATLNPLEFCHDVTGIRDHIDRETGKLLDCFVPRTSRRAAAA